MHHAMQWTGRLKQVVVLPTGESPFVEAFVLLLSAGLQAACGGWRDGEAHACTGLLTCVAVRPGDCASCKSF